MVRLKDGGNDTSNDGDSLDSKVASSAGDDGRRLSAGRRLVGLGGPDGRLLSGLLAARVAGLIGDRADGGRDGDGLGDGGDRLGGAVGNLGRALGDGLGGGDANGRGGPLGGLGGDGASAGRHLGRGGLLGRGWLLGRGGLLRSSRLLRSGGLLGGGRLGGLVRGGGLGRLLGRGRLSRLLRGGGVHRGLGRGHGGLGAALAVGDTGAGRRDVGDVVAVLGKLGGSGGNVLGGAGQELGAELLGHVDEALVNQVAVAAVVLAAGELVGHDASGEGREEDGDLHVGGLPWRMGLNTKCIVCCVVYK